MITATQVLELMKDVAAILATGVAIYAALLGVNTWRRQLKGHTEYDLARRFLRAVYRVRDSFRVVRSPMMQLPKDDVDQIPPPFEESAGRRLARTQREEYSRRLAVVHKAWSDLDIEALEGEVLWGVAANEAITPLKRCMAELVAGVNEFAWLKLDAAPAWATVDRNPKRVEHVERLIYELSPGDDQFALKVAAAVGVAEDFIRPHLRI